MAAAQITGSKIDFSTMPTGSTVRVDSLTSGSTNSTSYIDIPGGSNATNLTMAFTKKFDASTTKLMVSGHLAHYFSVGGGSASVGVRIGSTDYQLGTFYDNVTVNGKPGNNGARDVTGLAAGSYTCKLRVKTGGGTLNLDSNYDAHLTVMEIPV